MPGIAPCRRRLDMVEVEQRVRALGDRVYMVDGELDFENSVEREA